MSSLSSKSQNMEQFLLCTFVRPHKHKFPGVPMTTRLYAILALTCCSIATQAQVPLSEPSSAQATYFHEATDKGVSATSSFRRSNFHAATPTGIPGGRVIRTLDLKRLIDSGTAIAVVDVLDSQNRTTVPGATWLPDGGKTFAGASERTRFETVLQALTGSEKSRPLVFLCTGFECWLSYNAALAAIELGYKDVLWYRGGTNSWLGANLEVARPKAAP